ncbi:MAG: TonB-dependent receptor [Porticoccaceae bacterium]|nr:TonB-dependent receptor [Porticoccaceae bacterium]
MYKSNHSATLLSKTLRLLVPAFISTATLADHIIEEVIVTSDFRDSGLLKTAASITVFDSQTIAQRRARHLEQLINLAPNVNFSSGASRGRFIQIRGIGERSQFIEPLNPSVGILVDGIDFTGIAGAATTMDIAQVEILRGPQGTIYGANALAGLINLRSNQPTDRTQGNLEVTLGDYNTQTVSAAMGGPLSKNLGYRFAAQQHSSDGYIRNDFLKRDDTDNIDELSLRSILDWQASDNLDLKLTVFHVNADNGYDAFSLDNTRHTLSDNPGHDRQESTAVAVQSNWQANVNFTLVSLVNFADNNLEYGYDEDWAYGDDLCVDFFCPYNDPYNSADNYIRDRKNGSIDIRLVSAESAQIFNGTTDWVAGIYWREQDEELLRQNGRDFTSDFDTTNQAVYGQLDTQLSGVLRLSTGVRFENRQASYRDSDLVDHRVDEDIWGGRIALQYQLPSQAMMYGLISRGYKAGGVNSNPSVAAEDREFDTELMLNYELGAKGRWLDDALQAQVAVFYQQRDDIQIKQTLVEPREGDSGPRYTDYFGNSAKGSNYGVELEFNWLPTETLALFGSVGLLESEYDIPLSADLNSREQAHAPAYQFALGARAQITDSLAVSIDIEGKDEFYLSSSHSEQSQSYELVNANLTYMFGDWELSLWGRNLTDEDVIVRGFGGFGNDPRNGWITEPYYQLGAPRVIGFSGKYDF